MTGLDPERDKLLEIAVVITNGDLEPVDSQVSFVIRTGKETLDNMNEWCVKQHGLVRRQRYSTSDVLSLSPLP